MYIYESYFFKGEKILRRNKEKSLKLIIDFMNSKMYIAYYSCFVFTRYYHLFNMCEVKGLKGRSRCASEIYIKFLSVFSCNG